MEAILNKEIVVNKTLCRIIGVAVFVVLTSLGAFVRVPLPFTPVPITLQTFFVLLSGAFLGARLGLITQLIYILFGVLGLPIFSGASAGSLYFFGPTGGYLFGFVLSTFFVGKFIKYANDNLFFIFTTLCVADLILLSCGALWLRLLLQQPLAKILFIGLIPFVPGDLAKVLVASVIYARLKSRLKGIF